MKEIRKIKSFQNNKYTKQLIKLYKKGLISMFIILITMFMISKPIIRKLLQYYQINFTAINITESIDIQIMFTILTTLMFSLPMIINIFIHFLEIKKNKYIKKIFLSFILAITGFITGLTIMSKQIILSLNNASIVQGLYSIKNILTFGMSIGFVTALSLQLTLLIPLLHNLKIINVKKYNWINASILLLISYWICTILTPTDITSTLITMLPMNLSIFMGVKLSKINKCEVKEK